MFLAACIEISSMVGYYTISKNLIIPIKKIVSKHTMFFLLNKKIWKIVSSSKFYNKIIYEFFFFLKVVFHHQK